MEPEGNTPKENDDDGLRPEVDPGSPSSSFPKLEELIGREPEAPPVADSPPPIPAATRKATPEEIKAVEAKAFAIWGDFPETRAKVRELAVKFASLSWVDRALDIAAGAAQKKSIPIGFLVGTLRNFEREGGPPPPPSPKPAPHTVSQRMPMAPPAEPDDADLDELQRWAEGSNPALARIARVALAKRESGR